MLKNGAVFLHIPKTGGKWVISVLRDLDLIAFNFSHNHSDMERTLYFYRHFPMHFIRQTIKHGFYVNKIKKAFKFCFVRHPLRYYESYFKYASDLGWPPTMGKMPGRNDWHPNSPLYGCGSNDINTFVRNAIKTRPGYINELYSWYTTPEINFIGKTENLVDDLIKVFNLLGISFDKERVRSHPPQNVSKKPAGKIMWDEDLKKEVLKLEYPALVRYGYVEDYIYN
jgi:hypothetical protein